jgi:hypothetical protein
MKIDFCDLCNESVPLADLDAGRAVRIKGRVVCSRCEQLMHARSLEMGQTPVAPGGTAPGLGLEGATLQAPPVLPVATAVRPRGSGALALAALALLCAAGSGYWLYERGEKEAREQRELLASLRGELAELRTRNGALRVELEQRAGSDRQSLDAKLDASRQQVEASLASARQETQAVSTRIAGLEQQLGALQQPVGDDERQDSELKALQKQFAAVGAEVDNLGRALADLSSEHAAALQAVTPAVPTQPAWMGLVAQLSSADEGDRWKAVMSLGETRDPKVSEYLLPVLKDEDIFVRMATARMLGDLRAPEAVPALIEALGDPEPSVREAVYLALKDITRRDMAFDALGEDGEQRARQIQVWRDWWAKEQARQGG